MAHAARLNLRMQKELKLLLTDPPPGVSLPLLSGDADFSSLSSIDAQIEGPEGTVYAQGSFNVKIQIPDRYPFQPPIVTFATPIYHPNIDNGGRICLDILNLPPKGAWQPSLNISTVLASIGLLLGDPNPDDGLMCEASREYKYNRQAFDQKARSMTEKYAKARARSNSSSSGTMSANPDPNTVEVEELDIESKDVVNEYNLSLKKLHGVSRKLCLESSSPSQWRDADDKENAVPTNQLSPSPSQRLSMASSKSLLMPQTGNHDEQQPHQDHHGKAVSGNISLVSRKLSGISRKLSLESSGHSQRRASDNKNNVLVSQHLSLSNSQSHFTTSSKSLPVPQAGNHDEQQPHQSQYREIGDESTNLSHNKLCKIGQKLSLKSLGPPRRRDDDDNENVEPAHKSLLRHFQPQGLSEGSSKSLPMPQPGNSDAQRHRQDHDGKEGNGGISVCQMKLNGIEPKLSLESLGSLHRRNADYRENVLIHHLPSSQSQILSGASSKSMLQAVISCEQQSHQGHDAKDVNGSMKQQEEETSPITETVIVLDSEDSEEEDRGLKRSRLSLARKRLTGKCKARA